MNKDSIDLTQLNSAHDFESLVTTFVFLSCLQEINLIRKVSRDDLFWQGWKTDENADLAFRAIFVSSEQNKEQREWTLRSKFKDKVESLLQKNPDYRIDLFINLDNPPSEWSQIYKNVKVIKASDISDTIEKNNWQFLFRKYTTEIISVEDAKKCEFLEPFTKSLLSVVDDLTIKETLNVISWIKDIAFYTPGNVNEFCKALIKTDKSPQEEKHLLFGETTLSKGDYLSEIGNLLEIIASHEEYFEEALENLILISSILKDDIHPLRGYRSQNIEKVTGYYYGRDFLVRGNRAIYIDTFNKMTLDVIERLLNEEHPLELKVRCLAIIPSLLRMKVETSAWSRRDSKVTWTEYRLPLNDDRLKGIRKRAYSLLFSTFHASEDRELIHRCIEELSNILQNLSFADDLQDEFADVISFFKDCNEVKDPTILSKILEMLKVLERSPNEVIKKDSIALREILESNFELQLYHILFGNEWIDPASTIISKIIDESIVRWGSEQRDFFNQINSYFAISNEYPTGLRNYFLTIGSTYSVFTITAIRTIFEDQGFRRSLCSSLINSIGYLLCGVRLSDEKQWDLIVEESRERIDDSIRVILLTGLQIHNYNNFTSDDIVLINELIADANEDIRLLAAETLWYFDQFDDYLDVLYIYESLTENMTEQLISPILKGLSSGAHRKECAEKWTSDERKDILYKIILTIVDYDKLSWDSMVGYDLEQMLRILWDRNTDDIIEVFKCRLRPERVKRRDYAPLPYRLNYLFQEVSAEKQNEFVSKILNWDIERYGIYWLARLIGLACEKEITQLTLLTFKVYIKAASEKQLILVTSILSEIKLSETFYDLAMQIAKKGYGRRKVRSQLFSSFVSKTGGTRSPGHPFPSHLHHRDLIKYYRVRERNSKKAQAFLNEWENEIEAMIKRDEQEDLEF